MIAMYGSQVVETQTGDWWMVSSETVSEEEVMVSFDVQSLFTNVPTDRAPEVIHERMSMDDPIEDRMTLTRDQVTLLLDNSMSKQMELQWDHLCHLSWPTFLRNMWRREQLTPQHHR